MQKVSTAVLMGLCLIMASVAQAQLHPLLFVDDDSDQMSNAFSVFAATEDVESDIGYVPHEFIQSTGIMLVPAEDESSEHVDDQNDAVHALELEDIDEFETAGYGGFGLGGLGGLGYGGLGWGGLGAGFGKGLGLGYGGLGGLGYGGLGGLGYGGLGLGYGGLGLGYGGLGYGGLGFGGLGKKLPPKKLPPKKLPPKKLPPKKLPPPKKGGFGVVGVPIPVPVTVPVKTPVAVPIKSQIPYAVPVKGAVGLGGYGLGGYGLGGYGLGGYGLGQAAGLGLGAAQTPLVGGGFAAQGPAIAAQQAL